MKKSFNILLVLLVVILAVILQKLEWIPMGRDLLRNYNRSLISKEEMKDLLVQEWRKHFGPKKSDLERKHLELASWAMSIGVFLSATRTEPLRPFLRGSVQLIR